MQDSVRFEFGRNWASYAKQIDEGRLLAAVSALRNLLPDDLSPVDKSFLDIGSGSGLHSAAASRIGFKHIVATDYDTTSVATTKATAARFSVAVDAMQDDILHSKIKSQFDVVYSWGVLHHTGNMAQAIQSASTMVKSGGLLIIAIYVKTPLCVTWKHIKRAYSSSPVPIQKLMAYGFHGLRSVRQIPNGELFKEYATQRGMDRFHDSVDWLGGYPYESATPTEVVEMVGTDFDCIKSHQTDAGFGAFGTGCGEYVFVRK